MPGWNPDALVSRAAATHATVSDVEESADAWRSAAAKYEQKRWAEHSEMALQNDAQFKRHQANVERALGRFESVSEWADFISFLSRLLKTLQGAPKFNAIPHKLIVAKRLSQCLNPALPSGVHARALDVYSHIFTVIGVDGLRRDLPVWTPGLLPFFQNAATSVRPALLDIFDRFYVPLNVDLRPVTHALLLSLLPGLEEESSEFFDRVVRLLDQIAASVGREFFLQNIWLVLISSKAIRLSALNYLARRMPKLRGAKIDADVSVDGAGDTSADTAAAPAAEPGVPLDTLRSNVLVRGFVHTLGDDSLLVRRNALDFLVGHLPLASQAFGEIAHSDRVLLLDAAIGAVLRRDISLNRRLYAWLLGPSQSDEAQQAYFHQHALPYVTEALRSGMQYRGGDNAMQQRPYKILVSLMDKAAIAEPLQRAILLDAFAALVHDARLHAGSELFPTAQVLFESVNAYVLYQQLFVALRDELNQPDATPRYGSAVRLFAAMLRVFVHHDEDALAVHLPALYLVLVEWMHGKMGTDTLPASLALDVLALLEQIQAALPARVYVQHTASSVRPLGYAATFLYVDGGAVEQAATLQDQGQCTQLVERLLAMGLERAPHTAAWSDTARHAASLHCFRLLLATLERLDAAQGIPGAGDDAQKPSATQLEPFDAAAWDVHILGYLATPLAFPEFVALLRVAMRMATSDAVPGTVRFASYAHFEPVLLALLAYLRPGASAHHAEAAELFWALRACSPSDAASSILCTRLTDRSTRDATLEALGTLWRSAIASGHAAELLAPVLLVLDGVRSADVPERSANRLWLRMYVSDYVVLLTLVLDRLRAVHAERVPKTLNVADRAVQAYEYADAFDQDVQNYYLETLGTLLELGGAALVRAAHAAPHGEASVLDVLTEHVVLLLRSVPPPNDWLATGNEATHALCLALVGRVLAVESVDRAWCADIQHHLVEALLIALARRDGAAQVTLLAAVYSVVETRHVLLDAESGALFAELVRRGLYDAPSDGVFFAWTAFLAQLLPFAREEATAFLLPLCTSLGELLAGAMHRFVGDAASEALLPTRRTKHEHAAPSEDALVRLVGAVEPTLLQALALGTSSDAERATDPELAAPTGFLGNISSVFTSEVAPSEAAPSALGTVPPALRVAAHTVQVLAYVWSAARGTDAAHPVAGAALAQATASLERVYRQHAALTIEAIVELWWTRAVHDTDDARTDAVHDATVALLECLAGSEQVLVSSLSDAITSRLAHAAERKRATPRVLLGELVFFRFLERYLAQLGPDGVAHTWPVLSLLAKNIASNHAANKALVFATLRVVAAAGVPLAASRMFEDRRTRRDAQDTLVRLCEQVISLYARTLDVSASRRSTRDSDSASHTDDTPDDAQSADTSNAAPAPALVVAFFATTLLPALEPLAVDTDKSVALCTSLVYYVLTPGFRARQRTMDIDPLVLELLAAVCRVPGTIKTWRTLVVDTFTDAKFFSLPSSAGRQWSPIVATLYVAERDRLVDVVGRIATTPTNNLFTSRETDLLARAVSIRRLAYTIYAGERNTFLAQLPLIQEKVVDVLRSNAPELVQAEIYLCMRVLLCRFASQHLAGFWPIILTELLRLFGKAKRELPKDHTDAIHLLFSTAKLADYLLTLQTEDFQIHQWLLITDTPDAVDPPTEWIPESLLDCIGRVAMEHLDRTPPDPWSDKPTALRRPMLGIARADTMQTLEPFFVHVSRIAYANETVCTGIDWDAINQDLLQDLFEPIVIHS
ncbi:hypothetical protein MBRA1_000751 [Malassezia brasiliensis]|uniref:Dopey N-terminal domain-containing protein n=1 Tax=Malassezia brasiliensis TaxID=1821822 RepID=A0AAF0DUC0_9BASI|nr:hypothetical protein MBRA1_000751 [Malassezia brasiliensis]